MTTFHFPGPPNDCTVAPANEMRWRFGRHALGFPGAQHGHDPTQSINQEQEASADQEVIIALYAAPSFQSTQQRPVCKDSHPSFYKGHILLQS